jgi:heme A synthase
MLLLALGLAALGIATPGSHSTVVMLGNLLGGLLLFALAWNLWRALHHDGTVASPALARAALACTLLWLLQAALGARSGAGGSAVAPALHLALAVAAGTGALLVGQAALRAGRRGEGRAVVAVVALQALWGPLTVAWNAPAAAVLVHNAGAAIGIALLFGIAWVPRAPLREMAA